MNTEIMPAPGVAAEKVTPVEAVDTPELAAPEPSAGEPAQTEDKPSDDGDKTVKRMERRIGNLVAARERARAEAQQLREQIAQWQQAKPAEEVQLRQEDVERLASERAAQLVRMQSIHQQSTAIRDALVKEVGADGLATVLQTVSAEAGELVKPDGSWTPLGEAIAESDNPAKLLAYLSKNPEAAEGLGDLSPIRLGRKLAAIEAEMSKPKEPTPSRAPKPIEPVRASGANSAPSPDSPDYMAWKLKQLRG